MKGSGKAPRVGGVDIEPNRGPLERKLVTSGIARGLRGADPRRSQPRHIERQIGQRMIVRRVLRVTAGERRVGKRASGSHAAQSGGRVRPAHGDSCAARERGSDRVGAAHWLLCAQQNRGYDEKKGHGISHGEKPKSRTLRQPYTAAGKSI